MTIKLPYLSDEHQFAIARLSVYSAESDHVIELLVSILLGDKKRHSEFIVTNLSTDRQIGLMQALLEDMYPSETAIHSNLCSDIKAARLERNSVMHSLVRETGDPAVADFISARPYRLEVTKPMTATDIEQISKKLRKTSDSMYEIARRTKHARKP